MAANSLPAEARVRLISTARTGIGDELRSVTYFTPDAVEQLYLRGDLEADADLVGFAETERLGFRSQMDYRGTELGEYLYTVRVYEHGYLMRVIEGDQGVFVTTDQLVRERFEELAVSLRQALRDLATSTPRKRSG